MNFPNHVKTGWYSYEVMLLDGARAYGKVFHHVNIGTQDNPVIQSNIVTEGYDDNRTCAELLDEMKRRYP